jgi:hypothetical protein
MFRWSDRIFLQQLAMQLCLNYAHYCIGYFEWAYFYRRGGYIIRFNINCHYKLWAPI